MEDDRISDALLFTGMSTASYPNGAPGPAKSLDPPCPPNFTGRVTGWKKERNGRQLNDGDLYAGFAETWAKGLSVTQVHIVRFSRSKSEKLRRVIAA
jgi:hypothetical protein